MDPVDRYFELLDDLLIKRTLGEMTEALEGSYAEQMNDLRNEMTPEQQLEITTRIQRRFETTSRVIWPIPPTMVPGYTATTIEMESSRHILVETLKASPGALWIMPLFREHKSPHGIEHRIFKPHATMRIALINKGEKTQVVSAYFECIPVHELALDELTRYVSAEERLNHMLGHGRLGQKP